MSALPLHTDERVRGRLQQAGQAALAERDISILDKKSIAPRGDRQDYHSLAPHFHGGQRVDGVRRAESRLDSSEILSHDRTAMDSFCRRTCILAISGTVLRDQQMLEGATRLVRLSLINPSTRMNPNLNHAQRVESENQGRFTGVLDNRDLWFLPQTIELLHTAGLLDASEAEETQRWCKDLLGSLAASPQLASLKGARNNIATWALATVIGLRLHAGQIELAVAPLREDLHLIEAQFGP